MPNRYKPMTTLIIVDGVTPDNFSPAEQYVTRPENLGRQEIGRLVGLGRLAGTGPLPRFVEAVAEVAQRNPEDTRLLFIADHGGFSLLFDLIRLGTQLPDSSLSRLTRTIFLRKVFSI